MLVAMRNPDNSCSLHGHSGGGGSTCCGDVSGSGVRGTRGVGGSRCGEFSGSDSDSDGGVRGGDGMHGLRSVVLTPPCVASTPPWDAAPPFVPGTHFDLQRDTVAAVPAYVVIGWKRKPSEKRKRPDSRDLRFAEGDEVDCNVDGCWHRGIVVTRNDTAQDGATAPYQVMLVDACDNGNLVWAPSDSDGVIRKRRSLDHSLRVEDAVAAQIEQCDPEKSLHTDDYFAVLTDVTETVLRVMRDEARAELDGRDSGFIAERVQAMLRPGPGACEALVLAEAPCSGGSSFGSSFCSGGGGGGAAAAEGAEQARLQRLDHVVCLVEGERLVDPSCASGVVHAVNVLPMRGREVCVTMDAADARLITVSEDDCHLQRAATCDADGCPLAVSYGED